MINKISEGLRFAFAHNAPGPFTVLVVRQSGRSKEEKKTEAEIVLLSQDPSVIMITSCMD